jgi:hypothetical protein
LRWWSLFITLCVLVAVYAEARGHPTPESAEPFHARIRELAAEFPMHVGHWTGTDQKTPPEAQKLLKPNAQFARRFRSTKFNTWATVVMVQCKDARDMAGHYPPVCYPAHGWEKLFGKQGTLLNKTIRGRTVPVMMYDFRQGGFGQERTIRIYNFFVVPGKGTAGTIEEVRAAGEDYRIRPFGAAQVQLMVDPEASAESTDAAFEELIGPMMPLIEALGAAQGSGA